MKYRDLFEDNKVPLKLLPVLVNQHMEDSGFQHVSSETKNGYVNHVWSGPKISNPKSFIGPLERVGFNYRGKDSSYKRGTSHYLRAPTDSEINYPSNDLVLHTGRGSAETTARWSTPTPDRVSVSRTVYDHGDARVRGYNEGSIHHREAKGPSQESVEGAYDHYLSAMGTSREAESEKGGGAIMGGPTTQHPAGLYVKRWSHFRSDL